MKPQTVIVMGPSGAGKGTQAALLRDFLTEQKPRRDVLYVQVGKCFRDIAEKKTRTASLVDARIDNGELLPAFMTVWAWSDTLIENYRDDAHLLFDGTPRLLREAELLDEALTFYGREPRVVIVLNVSKEWSRTLLKKRGRADDVDPDDVERRLSWYETEVLPVIDFFKHNAAYHVVSVDGEGSIEDIHGRVVAALQA